MTVTDLILWRHADAAEAVRGQDDSDRPLTDKGLRQAERMAAWLNERLAPTTRILVSPARRCQQTAAALARVLETVPGLASGEGHEAVLRAAGWPDAARPVLVVGHQPTMGFVASLLLTGAVQPWTVKKAGVWWLRRRSDDGSIALQAMQAPDCL